MELVVFVKRVHPKYVNDWVPPAYDRLRSITTEKELWERLGRASGSGEEVVVYDPERRIALRSKVAATVPFPGHWQVVFEVEQQKACLVPRPDFIQGRIAAEVQGGVVVRYY